MGESEPVTSIIQSVGPEDSSSGPLASSERRRRTQAAMLALLRRIERLVAEGYQRREIQSILEREGERISSRRLEEYLTAIYRRWAQEYERDRPVLVRRGVERLYHLYRRAIDAGDLRTALAVQETLGRVEGWLREEDGQVAQTVGAVTRAVLEVLDRRTAQAASTEEVPTEAAGGSSAAV